MTLSTPDTRHDDENRSAQAVQAFRSGADALRPQAELSLLNRPLRSCNALKQRGHQCLRGFYLLGLGSIRACKTLSGSPVRGFYLLPIIAQLIACATPYAGITSDAGSTLIADAALGSGGKEIGLIAGIGPLPVGLALSVGVRAAILKSSKGDPECPLVAGVTDAVGWGAACNNLAAAAGLAPHITLPLLGICAITAYKLRKDDMTAWCGDYTLTDLPCRLGSIPEGTATARCIDGRMALR